MKGVLGNERTVSVCAAFRDDNVMYLEHIYKILMFDKNLFDKVMPIILV